MPPRVRRFRRKRWHDSLRRRSCRCSGLPGRSCGVDCLRGRARWLNNLRGRNCRYRLSAVHAELRIAGKFRAAFRAIHVCHPLPDSLLLLGIVSPDVSDACNGRTMRACLHDFFTRFIPLFRNTPFSTKRKKLLSRRNLFNASSPTLEPQAPLAQLGHGANSNRGAHASIARGYGKSN